MLPLTSYFIFIFTLVLNASNGLPLKSNDSVSIVGGDEVDITEYPYQVLLLYMGSQLCGASIIGEEYILTAAHCLYNKNANDLTVKVGSTYTNKGGVIYNISEKFVHPKYDSLTADYDVAVLKTSIKISIDDNTTRIVKIADSTSSLDPGKNVIVTGWGVTENGSVSLALRAVTVPVVPLDYCKAAYNAKSREVTDRMLCAGSYEGGKDSCQGDSGGPAVDEERHVQYGIVSWGWGCALKEFPGVYTDIRAVRDWIQKVSGI